MTTMTSAEQMILEMINRARMDPDGEAARLASLRKPDGTLLYPNFTLNEHLAAGTISSAPKQVLAGNSLLTTVAEGHDNAMISSHVLNYQQAVVQKLNPHTQAGDFDPEIRITNAGYHQTFVSGQFYHDENVAWQSLYTPGTTPTSYDSRDPAVKLEDELFVDSYADDRGHRLAIMADNVREVGVGLTTGVVTWVDQNGQPVNYNSDVVTENFGISGTNSFLTGAVYNDTNGNFFYDINEGVANITATVTTTIGAAVGSDVTGTGGGWSVSEPGGTYNVKFTGGTLQAAGVSATVAGGNLNAKVDLVNGNAIFSNVTTTLGANAKDLHLIGIDSVNATGNDQDNTIYGNKGSNTIDGGIGFDTVVYTKPQASYTITPHADGTVTIQGPDGTDTLISIEKVQFSDGPYTPPGGTPVVGSVSIGDASIVEGDSGQQLLNFTVNRTGGTGAFSINYTTVDGTGANGATTADNDYVAKTSTLSFLANETSKVIQIAINGDTKVEGNETFNVVLSGITGGGTIGKATGLGIITNDDSAPVVGSVSIGDASIVEGNSGQQLLNFTVNRTGGTGAFSVNYNTVDGTGTNGATTADNDYVAKSSTLSFLANETSKVIQIAINGDTKVEDNESFNVVLSGITGGGTISKATGIGIITNDDSAPVVGSVSIGDASIVEGNNGQQLLNFTVNRTGGTAAFSVNYATADGTGANGATTADNDYVAKSSTLSFLANETSKVVQIAINGDTKVEGNETFNVVLSGLTGGGTVTKATGIGTIINDDVAGADDYSNTASTTGFVNVGGTATGNLEVLGDHDWFKVTLTAGHNYLINERGAASNGGTLVDPYLRLVDSHDGEYAYNDDSGVGRDAQLAIHVTNTGTYYIDASAYNDAGTGTYTVDLQDLGTSSARFESPSFSIASFGTNAGGWTSETQYPRELADVNGDGLADIVGFGQAGTYVSLATGGGHFAAPSFELGSFGVGAGGWTSETQYPRELADVNGDGLADIVGFGHAGTYVSLATGGGHFAAPSFELGSFGVGAGGWTSETQYPREVADVNGDGMADIVGFGHAGVYVSLATGGGHFAAPSFELGSFGVGAGGWVSEDQYPREVADVNGDGMADIVGFGHAGVYVSLATGGGHFAAPSFELGSFGVGAGGWTSETQYPRELADVNSDGMADIVGFGYAGVYVSLATGGGHFAAPTFDLAQFAPGAGGWSSDDLYPRLLADVTGDHRADIVGFGAAGAYVSASHDFLVV